MGFYSIQFTFGMSQRDLFKEYEYNIYEGCLLPEINYPNGLFYDSCVKEGKYFYNKCTVKLIPGYKTENNKNSLTLYCGQNGNSLTKKLDLIQLAACDGPIILKGSYTKGCKNVSVDFTCGYKCNLYYQTHSKTRIGSFRCGDEKIR